MHWTRTSGLLPLVCAAFVDCRPSDILSQRQPTPTDASTGSSDASIGNTGPTTGLNDITKTSPGSTDGSLHTSGNLILDQNNEPVKFRCVNWAGHMETNIPEGLASQTVDYITTWLAKNNFNCVRLTYSVDFALNSEILVSDSFVNAAHAVNVSRQAMQALYQQAVQINPFLANATVLDAVTTVIESLQSKGIMIILDNHVSKASWCCENNDGNGWFDFGTDPTSGRYFDIPNWLNALKTMATFAQAYPGVVGMSVRNEFRPRSEDANQVTTWTTYVSQAAQIIYKANPNLLIAIGGINFDLDLSFLATDPLDTSTFPNRTVWEFHWYSFSYPKNIVGCSAILAAVRKNAGFLIDGSQAFTGPLWLSEFGTSLAKPEMEFMSCLSNYTTTYNLGWAIWGLMGSYYLKPTLQRGPGKITSVVGYGINAPESWGLLDNNWTDWRNPDFASLLGAMFQDDATN